MRRYLVFASASLALLMYAVDATVVAVAFPKIIQDFDTTVIWAGWTMSIYYIAVTTAMPLMGNLSDSLGRKRLFLVSLALFTASSLACGLAPNIYTLVIFRFCQGIGGASFLPTVSGVAADHFPENRERVIGLLSTVFNTGNIIGPNLGGWIISRFSWRYAFYINLPIGVALFVLMMILLKEDRVRSRKHIDVIGASLFGGAVLFFMFGLNLIGESFAFHSIMAAALLLVSFCLLLVFFRQQRNQTSPILDTALLKSRPFVAANLTNMIMGAGFFGLFSIIPLYAVSVHKLSTLMSGMILTPRSIGVIVASIVTSFMLKRWGYRRPLVTGLIIVSLATMLLSPALPLWSSGTFIHEVLPFLILALGVGAGAANPAANNACIELMPDKVATIVGLRGMFRTVGAVLGISLITFILHLSSDPFTGFTITFIVFGMALLCIIPLAFLMPSGKGGWAESHPQ